MSKQPKQRPTSPYMLGSYYRFEFPTILSLSFRMTGIFFALLMTPLACLWVLMLALGPETFASMQGFMGSWAGKVIGWASALVVCYHLCAGIRHLAWDSGRFLEKPQIRSTGVVTVIATLVLWIFTLWVAS
jgi:succinate dehydrogenase / fumarate reductase cytochrome b subunit